MVFLDNYHQWLRCCIKPNPIATNGTQSTWKPFTSSTQFQLFLRIWTCSIRTDYLNFGTTCNLTTCWAISNCASSLVACTSVMPFLELSPINNITFSFSNIITALSDKIIISCGSVLIALAEDSTDNRKYPIIIRYWTNNGNLVFIVTLTSISKLLTSRDKNENWHRFGRHQNRGHFTW